MVRGMDRKQHTHFGRDLAMKSRTRFAAMGSVAVLALVAGGIGMGMGGRGEVNTTRSVVVPEAEGKTYALDPVHSNVLFKIKHMNVSNFYGRFNKVTGSFSTGEAASVDVTVDASSVDTNNSKRDDHVKSPDFFSVKEFGEMTFKSTGLKKSGDSWKGTGDLTFHGVKKSVDVELKLVGAGPGMGGKGEVAGVETSFTIKRSDYGVKGMVGMLGDEVTIWVSLEGGAK